MSERWFEEEEYNRSHSDASDGFSALPIPYRRWVDKESIRYRVYDEPEHYVEVIAATAAQALKESGIFHPIKVERFVMDRMVEAPEEAMTNPEGLYVRPLLERLTEHSAVVEYQVIQELVEAEAEAKTNAQPPAHPIQEASAITAAEEDTITSIRMVESETETPSPPSPATQQEEDLDPPSLKNILSKEEEGDSGLIMSEMPIIDEAERVTLSPQ